MDIQKLKELLTERLNETGFPLQEQCAHALSGLASVTKEFPIAHYDPQKIAGPVDILALQMPKNDHFKQLPPILYIVECKKSLQNIKYWCFIKTNRAGCDPESFFVTKQIKTDEPLGFSVELKSSQQIGFGLKNQKSTSIPATDFVMYGFETNNLAKELNRSNDEKVYNAVCQSLVGLRHFESLNPFLIDELGIENDRLQYIFGDEEKQRSVLLMPIVVTTNDIFVASFDPSVVEKGELKNHHVDWAQKEWVLYDFSFSDSGGDAQSRGIFVVRDAYLKTFCENLKPYFWS